MCLPVFHLGSILSTTLVKRNSWAPQSQMIKKKCQEKKSKEMMKFSFNPWERRSPHLCIADTAKLRHSFFPFHPEQLDCLPLSLISRSLVLRLSVILLYLLSVLSSFSVIRLFFFLSSLPLSSSVHTNVMREPGGEPPDRCGSFPGNGGKEKKW